MGAHGDKACGGRSWPGGGGCWAAGSGTPPAIPPTALLPHSSLLRVLEWSSGAEGLHVNPMQGTYVFTKVAALVAAVWTVWAAVWLFAGVGAQVNS